MDNQYSKRSRGTWKRPQNGNTYRLTQNNTKKNIKLENARPWWNTWLLVQEVHLHSRQTSARNEQMPTRRASTWLDDQRKDYINLKGPAPNNYRPIACLPMMCEILTAQIRENIYYSLTSRGRTAWGTERIPQRIQRHSRITLHRSTNPKWEQDKTEKPSYGLDWLERGIWYGSTKLDNTLSQNVQNIAKSHKLHWKDHANLESGADSRRKKLSWNKDPKRHFPRRCTITLTIHNSHDAT